MTSKHTTHDSIQHALQYHSSLVKVDDVYITLL